MSAQQAFTDIHRSLVQLGHDKASLFQYLGLSQEASVAETEAALNTRRQWAQGQQANPKFRAEATWLIRNHRVLHRLLLQHRVDYIRYLESHAQNAGLDSLELFMRGALLYGPPSPSIEAAILKEGERLGVDPDLARLHLRRLLDRMGFQTQARVQFEVDTLFPEPNTEDEEDGGQLAMEAAPEAVSASLQPRLHLDAPPILGHTLWGAATDSSVELRVANAGTGRMSGEVRVDQPWLRPEPSRLDPGRPRQAIRLRVDPELTPMGRSRCLVTVSTPRGGTESVAVEIYRVPPLLLLGGVGLLCATMLLLAAGASLL
jgi:hypothetical protein